MYTFLNVAAIGVFLAPSAAGQSTFNPIDTSIYTAPTATPSDFSSGGTPYLPTPSTDGGPAPSGTAGANNILGTFLYGYDGCNAKSAAYKGNIDEAYYDSWTIANTAGVLSGINWNEAPALEFLGAPGINQPQQAQIQAVLANVATVIYSYKNPFQHAIHVRCDDPLKLCENRPDQDPCNPVPDPGNPAKPNPTPEAYARNTGPGNDNYPMINFCDGFFGQRSLKNAYAYGSALSPPENFRLSRYDNRAQTFFHELLHLDLAADSPDPNPSILDLTISIHLSSTLTTTVVAYGPLYTKILARYGKDVGKYVQLNADNFAYFALAKYIMSKNGNVYPHLPIVTNKIDGPPWYAPPDMIASFVTDDGQLYLNITDSAPNALAVAFPAEAGTGDGYPGCSDDENADPPSPLVIDNMAAPSDFPSDYNSQVSSWISQVATMTSSSAPATSIPAPSTTTSSPPPAYATGTCSFHVDEWQDCTDDATNLFANITMYDNDKNIIGQTNATGGSLGEPINTSDPYSFISSLAEPLVVVGEHEGDYMQFTLGKLSWTSRNKSAPFFCSNGGWNPRDGPFCGLGGPENAENQVDCSFPC